MARNSAFSRPLLGDEQARPTRRGPEPQEAISRKGLRIGWSQGRLWPRICLNEQFLWGILVLQRHLASQNAATHSS